ncbi:MAG: C_GCAxxG_C_C family protein [Deltaproteobacteria bacterium]|nr:C_GCAxxG_C_C family protein [Deltaproteobacteria bacterium]
MQPDQNAEALLDALEKKAGDYEELFASCAQGTLLALQEHFNLGSAEVLKAATAMPGMALRGETCGAVVAGVMALGLAFGREKAGDLAAVSRTTAAARKLCQRFEAELGSCNCRDVQHHIFGRSFNLTDPRETMEFVKANAIKKCRLPAERAARITGELILEGRAKQNLAVLEHQK